MHSQSWLSRTGSSVQARFTASLVEIALLTGVVLRCYRAIVLTREAGGWLYIGGTFAVGLAFLLGMAAWHLSLFETRQWVWRAPLFALVEGAGEALAALALIALQREPLGSGRAELADWPALGARTLGWRFAAVVLFATVLASVSSFLERRREMRPGKPGGS